MESLQRWIQTMSWYTAKIDRVTEVLESSQYQDEALGHRLAGSDGPPPAAHPVNRRAHRRRRRSRRGVASVDAPVDLIYVVTMPGGLAISPANADGRPSSTPSTSRG